MKFILKWLARIVAVLFLGSLLLVIVYRFVPVPGTFLMLKRVQEQAANGKPVKLQKSWKSLDQIAVHMPHAVIASEDQLFLQHYGIDYEAIKKVRKENKFRKVPRGASTITQQVAKNVFLWPSRSWVRKGLETYFTFLIELFWSKRRIIEVYLNVAEMGEGIYGVEAAAQHYYKKPAKELTLEQAARLTAVLPNPRRWSPRGLDPFVVSRSRHIQNAVRQMRGAGMLPDDLSAGSVAPKQVSLPAKRR